MRTHYSFIAALLAGGLLASGSVLASGHVFTASNAKWKAECSACHVAYPARLLPAESWKALMRGLDQHFGSDASLDPVTADEITTFLQAHAGKPRGTTAKPPLRITETGWFKREHDEVPAATWKSAKIKSAANCAACHTKADNGDFSERSLSVPR